MIFFRVIDECKLAGIKKTTLVKCLVINDKAETNAFNDTQVTEICTSQRVLIHSPGC